MSTTRFWLIRHGETQWNADRRLQGQLDIPLSATGVMQATRLNAYLRTPAFEPAVDVIVTSDLERARETARIAAGHLGIPLVPCPELRERCYGVYEGRDWAELKGKDTGVAVIDFSDPAQDVDQGESLADFDRRIQGAFAQLAARYRGKNVLAFSHGGVIDIVWRRLHGHPLSAPRPHPILNVSINAFSVSADDAWTAGDWGYVGHLQAPALDDVLS
ncbi:MAG TPA: histidine phosphatase family protein [Burkholderiaceae bacterium]|jgi:probable phosphoglycerate mutase|nr:histidine phosphatase family protein [Burkholderiaceae bacterium]